MQTMTADLSRAITAVQANLASLNDEIDRMPSFKKSTRFGQDRLTERSRLLAQRDRLWVTQRRLECESN